MQIFLDNADIDHIRKYSFINDDVTTDPSLIAKTKIKYSFEERVREISNIEQGPISAEIMSPESCRRGGGSKQISRRSQDILIKIPMTGKGLKATKRLSLMNIKKYNTLIFSASQAFLATHCGGTCSSVFGSRPDEISHNGIDAVRGSFFYMTKKSQVITMDSSHKDYIQQD